MEVTRRRGRRRKKLLDERKDRRGYSHLKEEALDHTMWRSCFGWGFGPVVRQNTEWMNIYTQSHACTLTLNMCTHIYTHSPMHLHWRYTGVYTVYIFFYLHTQSYACTLITVNPATRYCIPICNSTSKARIVYDFFFSCRMWDVTRFIMTCRLQQSVNLHNGASALIVLLHPSTQTIVTNVRFFKYVSRHAAAIALSISSLNCHQSAPLLVL
jgi:hypothetical protein